MKTELLSARASSTLWPAAGCGLTSLLIYAAIHHLANRCAYEIPQADRPLRLVLGLFGVSVGLYLTAQWLLLRQASTWTTRCVITFAILFRLTLITSEPIQEIDIYRYIWDGVATVHGVNPYEYPPLTVIQADRSQADLPEDLRTLAQVRDDSPAVNTLLQRVHFGDLPTVYPPLSQAVFAVAAWTCPGNATVSMHITWMKGWLLLFDVGTIFLVALLIQQVQLHPGWLASYSWCPLVLKEFANSGHLDAIAIFFCMLAIYLAARAFFPTQSSTRSTTLLTCASLALAMGVGAKLYPVVLVPIMALTVYQRRGMRTCTVVGVVWLISTMLCLWPMIKNSPSEDARATTVASLPGSTPEFESPPTPNTSSDNTTPLDRQAGLKAFLSYWMMNDFIFLNLIENLTPDALRDAATPWFVVVPDGLRVSLNQATVAALGVEASRAPFVTARTITGVAFFIVAMLFAWRGACAEDCQAWLELVFLTLAWFWLLLPTLNPWYWLWAVPLVCFARNRSWMLLSGLLFIYYLRFYFGGAYAGAPVVTWLPYHGESFFDYVIVWIEYVPWFVCLVTTRVSVK